MLATDVNNSLLARLGIKVWHARTDKHPTCAAVADKILLQPLRLKTRCTVIVFMADYATNLLANQKILAGMLSVLNLQPSEYMLVEVIDGKPNLTQLTQQIVAWQSQSILQLGMEYPILAPTIKTVRTYSPQYLQQNTAYKAQAYKDLLTLRNYLHHGTSS